MGNASGLDISINLNPLLVVLAILILSAYTYFIYKYTIPAISGTLKSFLIVIRSVVLIMILLLIFEPTIINNKSRTEEPVNYIFVDNSSSMVHKDSATTATTITDIVNNLGNSLTDKSEFFLFGKGAANAGSDPEKSLSFTDRFTSLESILNQTDSSKENVANIILISDGIFNTGSVGLERIEDKGIPINVIAVGDTTQQQDIEVKSISTNDYVYTNKKTIIEGVILNELFAGHSVQVELLENNKIIDSRTITLDQSGINRVLFDYTPATPGEVKLTYRCSVIPGEVSSGNNSKTIYRKILDSKTRVGLFCDSPSPDLEFIKNIIKADQNYSVIPFIRVNEGRLLANSTGNTPIDSLDILVLINYPGRKTSDDVYNSVKEAILTNNKPFMVILSPRTNLLKLNELSAKLPFENLTSGYEFTKSQVEIVDKLNALVQINSRYSDEDWLNLPPIPAVSSGVPPKAESSIVATSRIKNIPTGTPLLMTRSVVKSRSAAILAHEVWRWQLQGNTPMTFPQLMANIMQWLKVNPELQKFKVTTDKKIYSVGEDIDFTGELFDEKLAPILDAEVKIELNSDDNSSELFLALNTAGIYSGSTVAKFEGDMKYNAKAMLENKIIAESSGKISVEKSNLELLELSMNSELLHSIATVSGGTMVTPDNTQLLNDRINENNRLKGKQVNTRIEYKIWSHETSLIILIVLFSLEWFIRKRSGMI